MKKVSKVSFDLDNWFARLLYEAQMEYFHDKANRNISDDKRKNLKRKFRKERDCYPRSWDDDRDWLSERQNSVENGFPVYQNEYSSSYSFCGGPIISIKFKPKPLPG